MALKYIITIVNASGISRWQLAGAEVWWLSRERIKSIKLSTCWLNGDWLKELPLFLYKKWITNLICCQARSTKTLNNQGRFSEMGRNCHWWTLWSIPVLCYSNQYGDGHSWDCIPVHLLDYVLEINFCEQNSPLLQVDPHERMLGRLEERPGERRI